MSKLTSNPNGSLSYDSNGGAKQPENGHYCPYVDKINLIDKRMNGDEDNQGTFSDVKQILKNQEANRSWIKGSVFTFGTFVLMLFYFGITDHNKIQEFPDTYLSKSILTQVVAELKQQTAIMTKIVNSPNLDSLLVYRAELKELQQNSSFDRMMRATRGGSVVGSKKPVPQGLSSEDQIKQDALEKRYRESLKN